MWTEEELIRFYFATTLRRAITLIQMTVQKIGSDLSLSEVTAMLDARSGLREAYNDEIDEFINFDTEFVKRLRFYTKLISLAPTRGDSVDEALSMLMEYLSDVSDVNDVFQDSMMTCLELSSQIPNLACPNKPSQGTQAKLNRQPVIKESLPLEVISEYVWLMIQIKDQKTHKTPMYWLIIMMRDDPQDSERDDISWLEEMKSRESILIIA